MELTSDNVRILVGIAGIGFVLYGWFTSDEGMARTRQRRRWQRNQNLREDLGVGFGDNTYQERDPNARENFQGGMERWMMLLLGVGLIVLAMLWKRIGAFLGQYLTIV